MSKAKAVWGRIVRVPIPLLCYMLVWAVWLCVCAGNFASDSVARANGKLPAVSPTIDYFETVDLEEIRWGVLYSTSHDPQLIWENNIGKVRTFRYAAEFSDEGHEMCLYYTNPGDKDFSEDKRVWPVQQADGSYLFTLPRTNIERLRLDPVSIKGLTIEFELFMLNEPQSVWHYFNPGVYGLVCLLLGPALLAAVVRWLVDTVRHYTAKGKTKRGGA